ncbi:hypothetical protein LEP1GSC202_3322 [Leptospira yanagawae serovar Saopaulo str. Sao Paulo = ATCC 700523]|uniref:Dolichyl-phosphate-mannose-protein mannosyltransferase n=1 Tax=Leptospira yanagawae serovar Saopaulo str. Sao Paulo = ATCC 700523 TaxID=1249483 RepID=A0A5E8HBV4_9LEPT|nr:hypothetical protein [Leptospira yanagawae]EOQ88332.1 hypothetical protein LEP1GSC202_3322 [Leptospira yanagawae serovar Saopaulo str. Sao Paulo = ATCC 700523]
MKHSNESYLLQYKLFSKMKLSPFFMKVLQFFSIFIIGYYFRSFTFEVSVLDWDEITYFIMGKGILLGQIPYVDLWDIKPIGIYLVHAISLMVLPYDPVTLRWTSFLHLIALTMVVVSFQKDQNWFWKLLSGLLVLYFFSRLTSGLSANSEIYFLFYEWFGIYLLLKKNSIKLAFFFLGIAFLIKYIIVFDVIFLGLYAIYKKKKDNSYFQLFYQLSFFLIPIGVSFIIYFLLGHHQEYFNALFTVSSKHQTNITVEFPYKDLLKLFWPAIFLGFTSILIDLKLPKEKIIFLILTITALIGASYTGYFFQHYFLALVPPLAIFVIPKRNSFILIPITIIFLLFYSWSNISNRLKKDLLYIPDHSKIIASQIDDLGGGKLFVASGVHATYIYLNQLSPTAYVQPVNYIDPLFAKNFSVDISRVLKEIEGIQFIQWCNPIPLENAHENAGLNQEFVIPLQLMVKNKYQKNQTKLEECSLYQKVSLK